MTTDSLCDKNATELQSLLVRGDIQAQALLESCIARIEQVNPTVNAVVTTAFDRAREEARLADKRHSSGETLKPLHGLPLLVKDLADTKGIKTTYGSRCFENHIPEHDSAAVARLRSAGAIVIGKTNTPEFGAGANTNNEVFGATCNPFNTTLTSGGSSGGSAVALACGMAPLATGSDLGGSLRIPASFCSVVGMRPSSGLVPSVSHVCGWSPLWTDGPMARTVADTALCLSGMLGSEPRDPLSYPTTINDFSDSHAVYDLKKVKVGFSTTLGVAVVDNGIAALFDTRKAVMRNWFQSAENLTIDLSETAEVFRVLRAESLYACYAELAAQQPKLIGANIVANLKEAEGLSLSVTTKAQAAHTRIFRQFQQVFKQCDILILPATAVSPFPVKDNYPEKINGESMTNYYGWYAITWALSLMACPVVTVPCGVDENGLPFGVQVVGPRFHDARVLAIAASLESALNRNNLGRSSPTIISPPSTFAFKC